MFINYYNSFKKVHENKKSFKEKIGDVMSIIQYTRYFVI